MVTEIERWCGEWYVFWNYNGCEGLGWEWNDKCEIVERAEETFV